MPLNKAQIAELIPHSGAMCLLDEVLGWDETRIRTSTRTHADEDNPLRHNGRLPAVCGIEYAAQAMAVHGSLVGLNAARPRAGYLVSARDVVWRRPYLDALDGDLVVEAERTTGDARGALYGFALLHRELVVASGSLMVVLEATGGAR